MTLVSDKALSEAIEAGKLGEDERWAVNNTDTTTHEVGNDYEAYYDLLMSQAAHAKAVRHLAWGIVDMLKEGHASRLWFSAQAQCGYAMAMHDLMQAIIPLSIAKPQDS